MNIEHQENWLYELCRRKGTALSVFFFLLTVLSYVILTSSAAGIGRLEEITGGMGILDTRFGYTAQEAENHFRDLGDTGRRFTLLSIIPLDMLFLISWSSLLLVLTCKMLLVRRESGMYPRRARFMLSVPAAAGIYDLLENSIQAAVLIQYPDHPEVLVSLLTFLTPGKFLLLAGAVGVLTGEIIAAGLRN